MNSQEPIFKMSTNTSTKQLLVYLLIGIVILVIIWQTVTYLFSTKKINEFYTSEITGTITDIERDFKGFILVETNNAWHNLSIYGACIDRISEGDNIQKEANSFVIRIVPKDNTAEILEYKCYTNKKFERRANR